MLFEFIYLTFQILHVIDEVLDSKVFGLKTTALAFLEKWNFWDIRPFTIVKFQKKISQNNAGYLYDEDGPHTYFMPIDSAPDVKFNLIDMCVLQAHIIKNFVLFTKPTPKHFPYETVANGESAYVIVTFYEENSKLYVKSTTLSGDSNHPVGEVVAEIVKANIPVSNGVVHLISKPLMVIKRPLRKFPFLPIYHKLSVDPDLNITYTLGERIGFNDQLKTGPERFTFFIPTDRAWRKFADQMYLGDLYSKRFEDEAFQILGRHLVVANDTYSMTFLKEASKNDTDLQLTSLSGPLTLRVKEGDSYFIKWNNKHVPVWKHDYECTNGIVHLVDDLFLTQDDLAKFGLERKNNEVAFFFWNALKPLTVKY